MPIRQDAIDAVRPNAGFYELAGPDELRAYFERVMIAMAQATSVDDLLVRLESEGLFVGIRPLLESEILQA